MRPRSSGDFEAVVLAETYDLLASLLGPYIYELAGNAYGQEASFPRHDARDYFFIRLSEFFSEISLPISSSKNC